MPDAVGAGGADSRTGDRHATAADWLGGRDEGGSLLDRELIELLDEVRVVLPGVQALFAFLLVLFGNPFEGVGDLEQVVYLGALLARRWPACSSSPRRAFIGGRRGQRASR